MVFRRLHTIIGSRYAGNGGMKMRRAFMVVAGLLVSSTTAMAWSWTGDEAGQKLDREARHWITTQNVCGVQLKASYLSELEARITVHFRTMFGSSGAMIAHSSSVNSWRTVIQAPSLGA